MLRQIWAWLTDHELPPARRRAFGIAVFAVYVLAVVVSACCHEPWRDEVRALTLALEPASVSGLPATLQDEGHPPLWHLLLRVGHAVLGHPVALQVVGAAIGIAAAALLFTCAPLPTWARAAFLFGLYPLYEYSVMCRNYGIGMLLVFVYCRCVAGPRFRPAAAAAALALLSLTSIYGVLVAGGLLVHFVVSAWRRHPARRRTVLAALVVMAAMLASLWVVLPTPESKLAASIDRSLVDPWRIARLAFEQFDHQHRTWIGLAAPFPKVLVLLLLLACVPRWELLLATAGVFAGAAWFMQGIYQPTPRHVGMLYTFVLALLWLLRGEPDRRRVPGVAAASRMALIAFAVPWLLLHHGYHGLRETKLEVESLRTSAPLLAGLLRAQGLQDAILVGEPDYYLDTMPYHTDQPIFVPREQRFARRVSWTTANRQDYDLGQLLATAARLKTEQNRAVVLVIGHPIDLRQPSGTAHHGYGDRFTWTAEQHAALLAATTPLGRLPGTAARVRSDEVYEVFVLR